MRRWTILLLSVFWVVGFVQADELTLERQLEPLSAHADMVHFRAARVALGADPHRPLYHFSAPVGLINDPNGFCYWRGNYHLFYQLKHEGAMHWGHAVSEDLVHWRDLPIAVAPTIERQCYSGTILVEDDRAIAMYHGLGIGNMVATASDPLLLDWQKLPHNPVIPNIKNDADGKPYRIFDPTIWKEADGYYSLSGTFQDGKRGRDASMVEHLFHSRDLQEWTYLHPLVVDQRFTEPGEDGAVPNFLPIGNGKHLLLYFSHKRAAQYMVGQYDPAGHRFAPESHGRMNFGPWVIASLHAPAAFIDQAGRLVSIFNMREGITADPEVAEKWYGMMTVPRRLSLDDEDQLRVAPIAELESLRFDHVRLEDQPIPANEERVLDRVAGKAMEIEAVIEPGEAREFGLNVFRSPDGREQTTITVYLDTRPPQKHRVAIDVSRASLSPRVQSRSPEIAPVDLPEGEPVRLRVFIDRSIVEVFINGQQSLSLRAYPSLEESRRVSVFARGGEARIRSLDAWQMRSIWPELKPYEGH